MFFLSLLFVPACKSSLYKPAPIFRPRKNLLFLFWPLETPSSTIFDISEMKEREEKRERRRRRKERERKQLGGHFSAMFIVRFFQRKKSVCDELNKKDDTAKAWFDDYPFL